MTAKGSDPWIPLGVLPLDRAKGAGCWNPVIGGAAPKPPYPELTFITLGVQLAHSVSMSK